MFSQTPIKETDFIENAKVNTEQLYHERLKENIGLYNGYLFLFPQKNPDQGSYYLDNKTKIPGNITYNNIRYENILLTYDIVNQKLVVSDNNRGNFELITERINNFKIADRHFTVIKQNSSKFSPGIYEIMFDGKLSTVYKKHEKSLSEKDWDDKVFQNVVDENSYYIQRDEMVFKVTNRREIVKAYNDRKNEVENFLKKENIKEREIESQIISVAAYYETINL